MTHTSVPELLQMTIRQFYRVYAAAWRVLEKRAEQRNH